MDLELEVGREEGAPALAEDVGEEEHQGEHGEADGIGRESAARGSSAWRAGGAIRFIKQSYRLKDNARADRIQQIFFSSQHGPSPPVLRPGDRFCTALRVRRRERGRPSVLLTRLWSARKLLPASTNSRLRPGRPAGLAGSMSAHDRRRI